MDSEIRLIEADIERIDGDDRFFSTRPAWSVPPPQLFELVRYSGITTPLILQEKLPGYFRIVSGFRRFAVAGDLGLKTLPAIVSGAGPEELFCAAVCENLSGGTIGPLERAEIARKFRDCFGFGEQRIQAEVLPLLGLPPHRIHYERLNAVSRLPEVVQSAVADEVLTVECALALVAWPLVDQSFFVSFIRRSRSGSNKQRQVFDLLDDLCRMRHESAAEIWEQSGAAGLDDVPALAPAERFNQQRNCLLRLRFPVLSEYEDRLSQLRKALALPPRIQLRVPPYFEGSGIELSIKAESAEELRELVRRLDDASKQAAMEEIFGMMLSSHGETE